MADRRSDLLSLRQRGLARFLAITTVCVVLPAVSVGSELRRTPIVTAVQNARPSIVNIRGEKMISSGASTGRTDTSKRVNGMGTGVIIDPRGYIFTNHHVVDGVREIQVTLSEGQHYTARLVQHDADTDLAIIKIDTTEALSVIRVGSSSDLMPGEPVIAIGNAYGYEHTVTQGIISALHREVQVSDAQFYDDLIQVSAAINPGNSGGPLLNIDGEMIGINVAVRAGAQSIGFAIPVNKAMGVGARLLAGISDPGRHGITFVASLFSEDGGLVVKAVNEDSPAAVAGIQSGDLVISVSELTMDRELDFHRSMIDLGQGDEVDMMVRRDGEDFLCTMTLEESLVSVPTKVDDAWEKLGVALKAIPDAEFRRQFRDDFRYRGGFKVDQVRTDSPAEERGIMQGDVLVGMHVWETTSWEDISYILGSPEFKSLDEMKFYVLREGKVRYGYFPIAVQETDAVR